MHSHSLFRLASKVYNTPHLITPEALEVVLDYLDHRNSGAEFASSNFATSSEDPELDNFSNGVGFLVVDGSLTYKPVMTMCGEVGTSYQSLLKRVEEFVAAGAHTIVMEVSSGGGEASHVFETANEIRALADQNNIKLIGYADTLAASAAYALISVCDVVVANPSAQVGSIGCVVALTDVSAAMAQAGIKRIYITAGKSKVPFAEDGSFKKDFLDEIQARVDDLNAEFISHVEKYTGLSYETIAGFEAKVYDAKTAKELGLVNSVMTTKEFAQYIAQVTKE